MSWVRVELRDAMASDLDGLVALERATANAPHWPRAAYEAMVKSGNVDLDRESAGEFAAPQRCLIVAHTPAPTQIAAQTDGAFAGFAVGIVQPGSCDSASIEGTRCSAELESVVVADSARRVGVGRALCRGVLDWCRSRGATEVVLEVRASSVDAIALYAGLGFAHVGRRPLYYRGPDEDAHIMRIELE